MIDRLAGYIHRSLPLPPPMEVDTTEVMNAWSKIDRILDSAYMDTHVTIAQNMLSNMLTQFGFTPEQRQSPLVIGMQEKINRCRQHAIGVCK